MSLLRKIEFEQISNIKQCIRISTFLFEGASFTVVQTTVE